MRLVEQLLALHKQTVPATQLAATDRPLDRLVYELYSLMEAEVWIVEGGS